MKLSDVQQTALQQAAGTPLTSAVPDRTRRDEIGAIVPGRRIFRDLIRMGLVIETEEDPIDLDGVPFMATPSYILSTAGERVLATLACPT